MWSETTVHRGRQEEEGQCRRKVHTARTSRTGEKEEEGLIAISSESERVAGRPRKGRKREQAHKSTKENSSFEF